LPLLPSHATTSSVMLCITVSVTSAEVPALTMQAL